MKRMPKPVFYLFITVLCVVITPCLAIRRGYKKIKNNINCCNK